jgi:leader peptidase (prepilin peptidase)/N-methyltransferase
MRLLFFVTAWDYWALAVLTGLMLAVAVVDLKSMIIPNRLVIFGIISGLLLGFLRGRPDWLEMALGCVTGGGILLLVSFVSRGGMGMGDVKLGAVLGIYLGWPWVLTAIFLAAFAGAVTGALLIASRRGTRQLKIPFGPFLALGTVIGFLRSLGWGP